MTRRAIISKCFSPIAQSLLKRDKRAGQSKDQREKASFPRYTGDAMLAPTRTSKPATAGTSYTRVRVAPCQACPFKHVVAGMAAGEAPVTKHSPLIEKLGGPDTIKVAVDLFYKKVLADERIKEYFENTDMNKQRAHQAAFMTYAFGGPNLYKGKDMAEAHRHLKPHLNETHFNAVAENFVATLQEMGVDQHDIDQAVEVVVSTKDQVLAE